MKLIDIAAAVVIAVVVVGGLAALTASRTPVPEPGTGPRIGEAFDSQATLNELAVARNMEINLLAVPFGSPGGGRAPAVAAVPPREPVRILRRAWHPNEQRFYYQVQHELGTGWVADTMVTILPNR